MLYHTLPVKSYCTSPFLTVCPSAPLQVGKALFDGHLLDVHFTRSFYKHILGVKVTYQDIEAVDPDYFKNLKWMLEVLRSVA